MEESYDLVLFDLNGTLSDPLVGIGRSINYALSHFGHAQLELHELAVHIGPPLDQAFRSITGVQSATQLNAFVAKYRERYGEVGYSENVLYPGIVEALAILRDASVPLGVCTSKRSDFAEQILEMFGLRSFFRFVSGGDRESGDRDPRPLAAKALPDSGRFQADWSRIKSESGRSRPDSRRAQTDFSR
jgi:phosphoglycolate phosphatase